MGKPLTVDMTMKNQTRPIEVDLTTILSQKVRITEEDDIIGNIISKWQYV